jgi:hypothetical protein
MARSITSGALGPKDIADLVEGTLAAYDRNEWVDISTSLQEYFAQTNFLLGDKVAKDGGDSLQWQVKVRNTGAAKPSGLYSVDDVRVADVMKSCNLEWKAQTTNFAFDVSEQVFNSGNMERIFDVVEARRNAALSDLAELMEDLFWGIPSNSTSEEMLKPFGIPYWIVRNDTKGWNGGAPLGSTFSTVAGLNPSTYPNWRNYTDSYQAIAKRDMVRSVREAMVKCNFKAPVSYPGAPSGPPRFILPTTYEVVQGLEEMLEEQNTNLGKDVASMDGQVMFRKHPVVWVPWLDANHDPTDTDETNHYGCNPIYGIDRDVFRCVFRSGWWMKRSAPIIAANQHNVRHIHFDTWMQYQCKNRRTNFVIVQNKA